MAGVFGVSQYQAARGVFGTKRPGAGGWQQRGSSGNGGGFPFSGSPQETSGEDSASSQRIRELLRGLRRTEGQNPYGPESRTGFSSSSPSSETKKKEKPKKPVLYRYREVAAKIRQAKTAIGANQAVLSAKRKVLELRRKISSGDGDEEELQLALTHAKKMELVARRKKHHLELEELAENTRKSDENRDRMEETSSDVKNALISAEEEKVSDQEDAVLEERQELLHEAAKELSESGEELSEEMLSDLNEVGSELFEEELKQLEESMELLENMEMIDPHMSSEELEELKRKHRAAENKAMMKADMDYLKGLIRHQQEKAASLPGMSSAGASLFGGAQIPGMAAMGDAAALSAISAAPEGGAVDVQV